MNGFDGVLFDMDGVIFDSERVSVRCWNQAAAQLGISEERMWQVKLQITGTTAANCRRVLNAEFADVPGFEYDSFRGEYERFYNEVLNQGGIPLKPGARELLIWLREHGKKTGLASSTYTEKLMRQIAPSGIAVYFDSIIGGDQVTKSKPDPEIYLKSLKRLGLDPEKTFGIEDSYNGVRSQHAAGLHPIMVPDILPVTEEMRSLAEWILDDLQAVQHFFSEMNIQQALSVRSFPVMQQEALT